MEKTVEAVICGHEITSAEVDAFIASLPREQQVYASHPDFRKQCVDQLIAVYALAKYGEEEKLDETEKFKAILENARKDILVQMAIGKIFEKITISDEEIREYFEANKARFAKGASVHAKHILVDSEDKCNELLESIVSGGKAFEDVAKESSTCPSGANGGDLGEFGKGQMVKEFEDAAFAAEIGHVVGPVKTQFGYHLIKVEDKKEAEDAKLDDVKEQIKSEIMQKKQQVATNVNRSLVSYVNEHLHDPDLSLNLLSNHFGVSNASVSRIFKNTVGQNFYNYITEKRMAKAKELLVLKGYCPREIATEIGYDNEYSFKRAFQRTYGITPRDFLEKEGKNAR